MVWEEIKENEVEPNFVKFENEDDTFEGVLVEVKPSEKYGAVYTFEADGEQHIIVGKMDLNRKLQKVKIGTLVKIVLSKLTKTEKKNTMKIFQVFYDNGSAVTKEETV